MFYYPAIIYIKATIQNIPRAFLMLLDKKVSENEYCFICNYVHIVELCHTLQTTV